MGSGATTKKGKNPAALNKEDQPLMVNKDANDIKEKVDTKVKSPSNSPLKKKEETKISPLKPEIVNTSPLKKINKSELWAIIEKNEHKDLELLFHQETFNKDELFNSQGQSVYHFAAQLGNAECLSVLIENMGSYNMSPDILNSNLATPLHLACLNNKEQAAKVLLQAGVNANIEDEHGQTPLFTCCLNGYCKVLEQILDASNNGSLPEVIDSNKPDKKDLTPLNCCAIKGDYTSSNMLIGKGHANVNCQSSKGCTPLMYASRGGYIDIVKLLIQQKADMNSQDSAGSTALHHAVEKERVECIVVLLESGADANIPDFSGRTVIFDVVEKSTIDLIKNFIKYGARLNETDYYGHTPLFNIARDGKLEIAQLLVENNADPNYFSIENPKVKKERKESTKEGDVFMQGVQRAMLPVQIAAAYNHIELMRYLLEKGAKPNEGGMKQNTALHIAALCKRKEAISILLEFGADPYKVNEKGKDAFQLVDIYFPEFSKEFHECYHPDSGIKASPGTEESKKQFVPFDDRDFADMSQQEKERRVHMMNEDMKKKGALLIQEEAPLDQSDSVFDLSQSQINVPNTELHYTLIANTFKPQIAKALMEEAEISNRSKALKWILKNYQTSTNSKGDVGVSIVYALLYCSDSKVRKIFNGFLNLFEDYLKSEMLKDAETSGLFLKAMIETGLSIKVIERGCTSAGKERERLLNLCIQMCEHPNLSYKIIADPLLQIIMAQSNQTDNRIRIALRFCLELLKTLLLKVGLKQEDPLSAPFISATLNPLLTSKWKEVADAALQIVTSIAIDNGMPDEGQSKEKAGEEYTIDPDILSKLQSKEKASDELTTLEIVSLLKTTKEPPYKEFYSNCGPYLLVL